MSRLGARGSHTAKAANQRERNYDFEMSRGVHRRAEVIRAQAEAEAAQCPYCQGMVHPSNWRKHHAARHHGSPFIEMGREEVKEAMRDEEREVKENEAPDEAVVSEPEQEMWDAMEVAVDAPTPEDEPPVDDTDEDWDYLLGEDEPEAVPETAPSEDNGETAMAVYNAPIKAIDLGHFQATTIGLTVSGSPEYEEWLELIKRLLFWEGAIQFILGDALNYGEHTWGEKYAQAIEETGLEYQTLRDYAWVCGRVGLSLRNDNLGFHHHRVVAPLETLDGQPDQEKQRYYLDLAEQEDLSVSALRQLIKADQRQKQLEAQTPVIITPDSGIVLGDCTAVEWPENIDLIVADPPYGTSDGDSAGVHDGKGEWDEWDYQTLHTFNCRWLGLAVERLKDEGSILVFGTVHNIFSVGHILKEMGLYIVRDIVWRKPFIQRQTNLNTLAPEHELILWARKGERHTCNLAEITRDVWEIQPAAPFHHPTEKPEALIERLIDMASNPGELVADPFLGSGATAAAAKRLKRAYWGVEQDEYWWKVATERVRDR